MNFDLNKDYYGILSVTSSAELAVIKAAYKALVGIYHPDRNPTKEAAAKMRAVNDAWDILSDPVTRKEYDEAIGYITSESDESDEANEDSTKTEARSESGINENLGIETKRLMDAREALFKELAKADAPPDYLPKAWGAVLFLWIPVTLLAFYGGITDWEDYPFLGYIFAWGLFVAVCFGSVISVIDNLYTGEIRRIERKINKIDKKIGQLNKSKTT